MTSDVTPRFKEPKAPKERKPMRRIGKRARIRDEQWQQAKRIVHARSKGRCEIRTPVCTYWATEVHHVEPTGMGGRFGKHKPEHLLDACSICHSFVERNRAVAYDRGWLKRRTQ